MRKSQKFITMDNLKGIGRIHQSPNFVRQGKRFIFAIGINQYQYCNTLYNAVKDAKDVVEILTSKYQFEKSTVTTLYDTEATRRNIYKCLDNFIEKITSDDTLLIYYSGHGKYIETHDEGFWIPVEGQSDDTSSFISNSDIVTRVRAIKAFHIVVISDSCFSGSLFGVQRKMSTGLQKQESIASRWLFSSGRNTPVSDGKPGKNSPFADNLLYHLKANQEPILPLTDLSRFTINAVANNSEQLPRCEPMKDVKHRGGEFMFHLKGHLAESNQEEPVVVESFAPPSVSNDFKPITEPIWLKWSKMPLAWVALVAVVVFAVWAVKFSQQTIISEPKTDLTTQDRAVIKTKENELHNPTTNAAVPNVPENGTTPAQEKVILKEIARNTVGAGKIKSQIEPDKNKVESTIKERKDAAKDNNIKTEEEPAIQMCSVYCETKGIAGVEVSFTLNGKPYSETSKSNTRKLQFVIPCNKKSETVNVLFSKKDKSEDRNVKLESFEIPELLKD